MIAPVQSLAIILNPRSGSVTPARTQREITRLFAAAGVKSAIHLVDRQTPVRELAQHAIQEGCSTVVACGGDGTVSAVAGALAGTDVALGIIPLGTRNHFARDLGIPVQHEQAVAVIVRGQSKRVDVAEVNGRVFINNSSLGVYPNLVVQREHQERRGRPRWRALALAVVRVMRRFPFLNVRVHAAGRDIVHRTPFVFVGNNEYQLSGLSIGTRACITGGKLYLHIAPPVSRARFALLAIRALLGRLDKTAALETMCVDEASIETQRPRVHVSTDGEVTVMHTPLRYRVRPGALKVIVP